MTNGLTISEIEERLKSIKGVSNVKYYTLVYNWGWTFEKNGLHYDLRRWVNCYGVDLGFGVFGTKAEEDTHHFDTVASIAEALNQIQTI